MPAHCFSNLPTFKPSYLLHIETMQKENPHGRILDKDGETICRFLSSVARSAKKPLRPSSSAVRRYPARSARARRSRSSCPPSATPVKASSRARRVRAAGVAVPPAAAPPEGADETAEGFGRRQECLRLAAPSKNDSLHRRDVLDEGVHSHRELINE
jgi:hypothetical protein